MRVSVRHAINAAHKLPGTQLHGHTYRITALLDTERNPSTGLTVSFSDLLTRLKLCTDHFDHDQLERTLAELPATAENLAICIARAMSKHFQRPVNIRVEVGDDGTVETVMYQRDDGEYFSK